jgi:hypothetical protein
MRKIAKILIGLFAVIGLVCLVYTIGVSIVVDRHCQMEVLAKERSPDGTRAIVHIVQICSDEGTIKHELSVGDVIGVLNSESIVVDFWETAVQDSSLWGLQFPVLKIRWNLSDEIVVAYPQNFGKPQLPEKLGEVKIFLKAY